MVEYPLHLARRHSLADGRAVLIRPIRADDEMAARKFFSSLSRNSVRLRFQRWGGALTDDLIRFYTHIDYDRHMAFVCEATAGEGSELVGEARYVANPGTRSCELGIVVADAWHHTGIAQLLMDALVRAARARGFETMAGLVLAENSEMLGFVKDLGFEASATEEDPATLRVVRKL